MCEGYPLGELSSPTWTGCLNVLGDDLGLDSAIRRGRRVLFILTIISDRHRGNMADRETPPGAVQVLMQHIETPAESPR
jgi:hypothetical protein